MSTTRVLRVFISHSAHHQEEASTQDFLDLLRSRLQALPEFDTLTDQGNLLPGDVWMQRLYAWMGLCDAAVILLSPRAVQRENSTWVPREANLLLWRKALDPSFVVIPVLLGGLQPADLADNPFLLDVRLNDLQLAQGLSESEKVDAIVSALQTKLARALAERAFDALGIHVAEWVKQAPEPNWQLCLHKHFAAEPWRPYALPHLDLALKMLRHAVVPQVDEVIDDLITGSACSQPLGLHVFDALYPLRLPAESACSLLSLCRDQAGRGGVVVNVPDKWALAMLLRAATGLNNRDFQMNWPLVELLPDLGDDDLEEARLTLAQALVAALWGTDGWELLGEDYPPEERLEGQYARLHSQLLERSTAMQQGRRAPIPVCVRYSARWRELAPELAAYFPAVVFLFWSGPKLPQDLAESADCRVLRPALPADQVSLWKLDHRRQSIHFGALIR